MCTQSFAFKVIKTDSPALLITISRECLLCRHGYEAGMQSMDCPKRSRRFFRISVRVGLYRLHLEMGHATWGVRSISPKYLADVHGSDKVFWWTRRMHVANVERMCVLAAGPMRASPRASHRACHLSGRFTGCRHYVPFVVERRNKPQAGVCNLS